MISLIIIFSYGYILHTKSGGIFQVKETYEYIFNIGTMRALGGIGLGYIIGRIYKEKFLTSSYNSIKLALCSTISEFILLYFIINNLILHKPNFNNHILFVIAFGAIIILFILKKGVISKLLEKNYWTHLSKYSYSIFITHIVVLNTLRETFWKKFPELIYSHPYLNILMTLTLVIIVGIITYHLVEKNCINYFKRKELLP